ncbi:MAG TPA: hypothetical protein H9829_06585 [Candidatus Tetragenococcus pullicola]|nr:hypothetical protein [Candidatus Tetragenococcus pullicola]
MAFLQDKPMKISHCDMHVEGISLQEFMGIMKAMQQDEKVGLSAHPEHFQTIANENDIIGIEPFNSYASPCSSCQRRRIRSNYSSG